MTVALIAGSFQAVEMDATGIDASGIQNLAEMESFDVQQLSADLAGPVNGGVVDVVDLNGRGYIDVDFVIPAYAAELDIDSVTDLIRRKSEANVAAVRESCERVIIYEPAASLA